MAFILVPCYFSRAAGLSLNGSKRFVSSEIHKKVTKLEVESALVTIANSVLGKEFVRQLVNLPKPPEHVFATCKNLDVLRDLKDLKERAIKTNVELLDVDMDKKEDLIYARNRIRDTVGDRGLTLLVNNWEFPQLPDVSGKTKYQLENHFIKNSVGPLMVTEEFLPLLYLASHRPEFTIWDFGASRASILNIPLTNIFKSPNEKTKELSSMVDDAVKEALTFGFDKLLVPQDCLMVQIDPERTKEGLVTQSDMDLSECVSDILNTLAECNYKSHRACLDRHGNILLKQMKYY